jgi:hypothetical protein
MSGGTRLALAAATAALFATAALADISTTIPASQPASPGAVRTSDLRPIPARKCRYTEKYILTNKLCQNESWRLANPDCAQRYC